MHKKLARFTFFPLSCLITTIESLFLWFVHFTTKSAHKCRFFSLFILLQIKNSRQARIGGKRVKPKKNAIHCLLFVISFLQLLFFFVRLLTLLWFSLLSSFWWSVCGLVSKGDLPEMACCFLSSARSDVQGGRSRRERRFSNWCSFFPSRQCSDREGFYSLRV